MSTGRGLVVVDASQGSVVGCRLGSSGSWVGGCVSRGRRSGWGREEVFVSVKDGALVTGGVRAGGR
ncbi:hypothetical protein TIFTF001_004410 [Ficus carica]|uniref:Uncharacterized protein n=1 Tax=Ficus carica TaxID=3494 RepID=A0AA88CXU6_FICCA|nr:hypothetical protein TIFTF001_004410 [Ficus carica]